MQSSSIDPESARAGIILLAALITLFGVILNVTHSRAKEVRGVKAKREVYRGAASWVELGFWALGIPASIFLGGDTGKSLTLASWIFAYIIGCWLFLTSQEPKRLRVEIFRLVISSQAIVLLWCMASEARMLTLWEKFLDGLSR